VQLFAQWSAAYRAPTINELYLNFTNPLTGYAQVGNPDLKPETGHGVELGANLGTERFGGRVTVFHNWYRNFIIAGPLTPDPAYPSLPYGIGRFMNVDEVEISGIELKAHKLFDNGVRLHGGLSYVYGKDVTNHAPLSTVAPFKAIAGIGYEQEHWGVDLTGIFVGRYRGDGNAATFDAPGYAIANLSGWWEPEQIKGMRIQAGVYNLFDKTYYDALAVRSINPLSASSQPMEFYSQPGRTFKVSLTHKF
jgi:hemoglobin/transferrin/lactoferrin receptor protein